MGGPEPTPLPSPSRGRTRLVVLALVLIGLYAAGRYSGLTENIDAERIRQLVIDTGGWGWLLYVAVFAGGEFIHIPGMIFVASGILVYGKFLGFVLGFVASVVSVSVSFWLVRLLGGTPLGNLERPWLQRGLAHLDTRPIRTVFLLRLFLWLAPALNYALALTHVKYRDYLIGSALGLIVPVAGAALLFDWLFAGV